jgi:hypothetical protein
MTPGD